MVHISPKALISCIQLIKIDGDCSKPWTQQSLLKPLYPNYSHFGSMSFPPVFAFYLDVSISLWCSWSSIRGTYIWNLMTIRARSRTFQLNKKGDPFFLFAQCIMFSFWPLRLSHVTCRPQIREIEATASVTWCRFHICFFFINQ